MTHVRDSSVDSQRGQLTSKGCTQVQDHQTDEVGDLLHITVFGRWSVSQGDRVLFPDGRSRQTSRLLARLAVAGDLAVSRSALEEAMWNADERRGTFATNLRNLRDRLGGAPDQYIVPTGDGYSLDRRRVRIDADEFARLVRAAGHGAAEERVKLLRNALDTWGDPVLPNNNNLIFTEYADGLRALRDEAERRLSVATAEVTSARAAALGADAGSATPGGRPSAAARGRPFLLPSLPFIGRSEEIAQLRTRLLRGLSAGEPVVVAVSGGGGVGKTALARRVAWELQDHFLEGSQELRLVSPDGERLDPRLSQLDVLRRQGGLAGSPGEDPELTELYRRRLATLGDRRLLLILDAAVDGEQVQALLPTTPSVAVIITSRAPLAELGVKGIDLRPLRTDDALALLTACLWDTVVEEDEGAARELVGLCAGLPHLIVIAAARILLDHKSVAYAVDQLRQDPLTYLGKGDPTVGSVLAYGLRGDRRLTAAFAGLGGIPADRLDLLAAEAAVGEPDAADLLGRLVSLRLLHVEDDALGRPTVGFPHRLDPSTRRTSLSRYAYAELAVAEAALALIQPGAVRPPGNQVVPLALGVDATAASRWFDDSRDSLVALLARLVAEQQWEASWRLAAAITPFLEVRADPVHWPAVEAQAALAAERAQDPVAIGWSLLGSAEWHRYRGDLPAGIDAYRQAVTVLRRAGDLGGEATALCGLGDLLSGLAGASAELMQDAEETTREGLRLFERIDNDAGRAGAWCGLGEIAALRAEVDDVEANALRRRAVDCFERSRILYEALADRRREANVRRLLAIAHRGLGRLNDAVAELRTCIDLFGALQAPIDLARTALSLAATLRRQGHAEEALQEARRAYGTFHRIQDAYWLAQSELLLGDLLMDRASPLDAVPLLERAEIRFARLGRPDLAEQCVVRLAAARSAPLPD